MPRLWVYLCGWTPVPGGVPGMPFTLLYVVCKDVHDSFVRSAAWCHTLLCLCPSHHWFPQGLSDFELIFSLFSHIKNIRKMHRSSFLICMRSVTVLCCSGSHVMEPVYLIHELTDRRKGGISGGRFCMAKQLHFSLEHTVWQHVNEFWCISLHVDGLCHELLTGLKFCIDFELQLRGKKHLSIKSELVYVTAKRVF